MKTLDAPTLAAVQAGQVIQAGAVRLEFGSTYRFWSGYGSLAVAGEGTFNGIGARGLIIPVESSIGAGASGLEMTLSALDPDIAASVELEDYAQKPVVVWRMIFDASGQTLLASVVFFRGRCDVIRIVETGNGEATIQMSVEGAMRDMDRRGARIRSDTDQRLLGGSTDGGMKHISVAGVRTLYWGQQGPNQSGGVVNGGVTGNRRDVLAGRFG